MSKHPKLHSKLNRAGFSLLAPHFGGVGLFELVSSYVKSGLWIGGVGGS